MAISGSIDFTVTRDDLIKEALEEIGVIDIGATPSAAELATATRSLNLMLKSWQADGVNLFAVKRTFLFLNKGINHYLLGTTASYANDINRTTTSSAASSGALNINLNFVTGITASTQMIIELANGDTQHVGAASLASFTVTLDAVLTDDVNSGATVYFYNFPAPRPMKILSGVRRDKSQIDIPLDMLTRDEYVTLSNKESPGVAVQVYFNPELDYMRARTWPSPSNGTDYLVLWVQRTLDDLDAAADNPAYPQEWQEAIALNLAVRLHRKFGVPSSEVRDTIRQAERAYDIAFGYDREGHFQIQPDPEGRRTN